jgi:N-acetylglucosaminyl-diphospho-decaprenol L-rhamnosyltransferase
VQSNSCVRLRAVVVTWQAAHLLPECLDSLLRQDVPSAKAMEIVVVDNASTDGTVELLAYEYPDIRVVRSATNIGFAGGVALGTKDFDGDVIVLLNNDAVFEDGAVARLVDELYRPGNSMVAAVTARILLAGRYRHTTDPSSCSPDASSSWEPTTHDDPAGVVLVNSTGNIVLSDGSGTDRDWLAPVGTESTEPAVFGFCGGAAALRWSAVESVGGFDPSLFLYYEDTDLSWRLRAHGWDVRYVCEAVAHHRHASSSGTTSPIFRYYNTRNSLIVVTRHGPWSMVCLSHARTLGGWLRAGTGAGWRAELTRARGRGLRDAVGLLPRTLRERRRLWAGAARDRRATLRPT